MINNSINTSTFTAIKLLTNKMNRKRPLSEIQPSSSSSNSPRSSARLEKKSKTEVDPENNNYYVPNTYRKIERLLSNGVFHLISLLQHIGI